MTTEPVTRRYEMVNVRPGYLMIEQENHTLARRSYFVAERTPPLEEYREGISSGSPRRRPRPSSSTSATPGPARWCPSASWRGCSITPAAPEDSTVYQMGDLAHDQRVSLYVAITTESEEGPAPMPLEKVRVLNALFNERLTSPRKKVLILPDLFGLRREITYEQIAIDFGLTSME